MKVASRGDDPLLEWLVNESTSEFSSITSENDVYNRNEMPEVIYMQNEKCIVPVWRGGCFFIREERERFVII
ncbi:hypothetical protein A374_03974 [Fictibacillus macauensis ZFHKF-1]|uniref:Uncharacterized protein n=1 Tax=Fictibacillus macauensis ZFHKF-1 TaxID=1196324 RepID=I8AM08_9BACL|nr:hypothetical protein A374_03974 [Fictibacillus macauensis ZFHKF-1]